MIFYTIYTSHPKVPMTVEILDDITITSKVKNREKNITGMLLGIENRYLQFLEGEEDDVNGLMDSIKKDRRHHKVTEWVKGFSNDRVFHDWSMGSWMLSNESLERLPGMEDIKNFLQNPANAGLQSTRFIGMMNNLLQTWIEHEPERSIRLKH